MTSIFILGNCHSHGMRRAIQFYDSAFRVESCNLWDVGREFASTGQLLDRLARFDHVLTTSFSGDFLPGLGSATLLERLPRTTVYPTVTFGAFHPDVVFVGKAGTADLLLSPLGPYHSALAIYGHRNGYSLARTVELFRAETYERLGYLSAWSVAMGELALQPEAASYGLPRLAPQWARGGCFMHTPQHPKLGAICDIAALALERIGLRPRHPDPLPYIPDDLVESHVWPVYPEIADFYGLRGSYTFKRASGLSRWPEFMTLEEFVMASYECYDQLDWRAHRCARVDHLVQSGSVL